MTTPCGQLRMVWISSAKPVLNELYGRRVIRGFVQTQK